MATADAAQCVKGLLHRDYHIGCAKRVYRALNLTFSINYKSLVKTDLACLPIQYNKTGPTNNNIQVASHSILSIQYMHFFRI